jgi:hypothetical protein
MGLPMDSPSLQQWIYYKFRGRILQCSLHGMDVQVQDMHTRANTNITNTFAISSLRSTQGDIMNTIEWSLLQDRSQTEEEKRAIRQAFLQLKRVEITIPSLKDLSTTFTNYVIGKIQQEWCQSGYYTSIESENLSTFTVSREGISNIVTWANEHDVAQCSCLWPSSRHYPCRHVIRVAVEKKRRIVCQIGNRWRQEISYLEDDIAPDNSAQLDDSLPYSVQLDDTTAHDPIYSPTVEQRTIVDKPVDTTRMGPTSRYNHLKLGGTNLAEVRKFLDSLLYILLQ